MNSRNIILICVLILVSIFSISCKKKKNLQSIELNAKICNASSVDSLKELVLTRGDTAAYNSLCFTFLHSEYQEEYLVYSLVMANKYNYKPAFYDVYLFLLYQAYEINKITVDETSKELALMYLKKGADLNEFQALREFWILYQDGKYVPKDTVLSKKFEERMDKIFDQEPLNGASMAD